MYDVVIAGYGPTGMMAAALLGRAGHRVAVIERYKSLYNLPRVGIVHDDVLRMFQELGLAEAIAPATYFLPVYELGKHGEVLLSNDVEPHATHGWPEMTSIYQPAFEAELDKLDTALPGVDVLKGLKAVGLAQDGAGVEVTVEDEAGQRRTIEGRWLIGADGGNSFVREALGISYADLGFDQNWLVIDAAAKPGRAGLPLLRQFCEPEQPGMTMQMGPGHRRWSFMIFPGEDPAEAVKPESVWRRLDRPEGGTPDEFELVRVVSYKFQSLDAEEWRVGRVFLAGDAAHQMPPFLAQGMCSGFRDAYNIAWKLDLVLKGLAAPAFLDSYAAERQPNARATIVESMRVGQNVNERDPEKIRARDAALRAMQAAKAKQPPTQKALIAFRVPGFDDGFIADGAEGAGDIFPQGTVRAGGREGRFDDVVGRGFFVLVRDGAPAPALDTDAAAFWRRLGGHVVTIGAPGSGAAVEDTEGVYLRLMDGYGADLLVKRPDYYLFGAGAAATLPALLADLRRQLEGGDPASAADAASAIAPLPLG
ncbi:MAG TPA: bifunctional 3-(3-hydroxy-phenyl)propionate/3-hydroxycinnamic acid hydroxylase [Hyphomicrobiales bacterium]|nr:bifunctional 3-(3-hydroxy-phenyl)propionate/3-hydroxycinnamic acid hydroxylase [Hyphomicrobiales bacterium]